MIVVIRFQEFRSKIDFVFFTKQIIIVEVIFVFFFVIFVEIECLFVESMAFKIFLLVAFVFGQNSIQVVHNALLSCGDAWQDMRPTRVTCDNEDTSKRCTN